MTTMFVIGLLGCGWISGIASARLWLEFHQPKNLIDLRTIELDIARTRLAREEAALRRKQLEMISANMKEARP
jgi:hypothetical protein